MTLRYAGMGSGHALRHQFAAPSIPGFGPVPLLVDPSTFDDKSEGDVAFSIESSNRKPPDSQTRDMHWRCPEVGFAPARASYMATLEELSACTAQEINAPVAALVTNAQAALRFLARQNPNLDEVLHALTRVLQLGNRFVEIVDHTRALVQRVAAQKDDFEISQAIRETISLNQEALVKDAVSVHTWFAHGLPLAHAARVQLQEVLLNLITNAVEVMSGVSEGTREPSVSTGRTNSGDIIVAVQDSGPDVSGRPIGILGEEEAFDPARERGGIQ
jgi:signal transduction histidine kinase